MIAMKMSAMCIQLVIVVALTISLSDVVAYHDLHNANISDVVHTGRYRREAAQIHTGRYRRQAFTLTPQQKSEVLRRHNVLRALEGADNMELMTWNDFLTPLAASWAAGCIWQHGQRHVYSGNNPEYTTIGQNLYTSTGGMNLTEGIQSWYDEKVDYNYDTLGCTPGKMCGHYTQVVWATSRHVGCAYHLCPTIAVPGPNLHNAYYLVCNYGPAGNFRGQKPYTKGPACSKCGNGAGWCKNKLCNNDCSSAGKDCSCPAICYNCAKLDKDTCRCSCADGWYGLDCSVRCEDKDKMCGANPGWPPRWCTSAQHPYVREKCLAMCQLCREDPNAVANQCPPVFYGDDSYNPLLHADDSDILSTTTSEPGVTGEDTDRCAGVREDGHEDGAPATFVMSRQMTMTFVMITVALTISNNAAL